MSTFLINIIAKSNLASVLATDDAAIESNNQLLAKNNELLGINSALSKTSSTRKRAHTKAVTEEASAFAAELKHIENSNQKIKHHISQWLNLGNVQNRVGYNIMGFSLRVGMWFLPAMALMATSMLPVIMGLLAMASAALLAGGALAAFLGLGILAYSRQQNKNGMYGGYGGPRRPYSSSAQQNTSIWTTLFEPIWKVLESPKLKGVMDNAKLFLTATINGLAEGLGRFFTALDPTAIATIEAMLLNWLPKALERLAKWGNRIFNLIGVDSLSRIGKIIDWIAGGIEGISIWLSQQGGWEQLDKLGTTIADVCSVLLDLGKSAFPILNSILAQIWPNPLKPMLEALTVFCETLSQSPMVMKTIEWLVRLFLIIGAIAVVILILSSEIFGLIAAILIVIVLFITLKDLIVDIVVTILSLFTWLLWEFVGMFAKASNFLLGTNYDTSKYDNMTFKKALAGEYAPETWKRWKAEGQQATNEREALIKNTGSKFLEIFVKSDSDTVENVIVSDVTNKTGSYDTINSQLAARRTVSW